MQALIATLNALTPAGLAGLLAYIIYLLIKNKKAVETVSDNHLSGLPEMQQDIQRMVVLLEQQSGLLMAINNNLIWVKARLNSRGESD